MAEFQMVLWFLALFLGVRVSTGSLEEECLENAQGKYECGVKTMPPPPPCGLYWAMSTLDSDSLSLFAGVDISQGASLTLSSSDEYENEDTDGMISIMDANLNERSAWHNWLWDASDFSSSLLNENSFRHHVLLPGIPSMALCANAENIRVMPNIHIEEGDGDVSEELLKLHRSTDATAGSFSYRHAPRVRALRDIQAGEELFLECTGKGIIEPEDKEENVDDDWDDQDDYVDGRNDLQDTGVCLDQLSVKPSTQKGVGRGAFAKRAVELGEVVATTPVLHLHRHSLHVFAQSIQPPEQQIVPINNPYDIEYTNQVVGDQLLLNYCFGDSKDSNLLLLPYAPGVNFINHAHPPHEANARIQWSTAFNETSYLRHMPAREFYDTPVEEWKGTLVLEFVATRNIEPGDEIFIDYGDDWVRAWEKHQVEWPKEKAKGYTSAQVYEEIHGDEQPIRTQEEQKLDPYPPNLRTACYFDDENGGDSECLRPCDVMKRYEKGSDGTTMYDVTVYRIESVHENAFEHEKPCGNIPKGGIVVNELARQSVVIVDKPYTSDVQLVNAFRYEMGVPDGLYPTQWMAKDPNPVGDFILSPLKHGQLAPIRRKKDAQVVSPWTFRVGMEKRVRHVLLDYAEQMGILDLLQYTTFKGNSIEPSTVAKVQMGDGQNWHLQRPRSDWGANMQWFWPGDEAAHNHYLQALSLAGVDGILKDIGEYLGMEGIFVFHLEFMGVSHATHGTLHTDMEDTANKTFNIIIPLITMNNTSPELDVAESDDSQGAGRYKYEYNVGVMLGDESFHGTAAVDNRDEIRLMACIYLADVTEENASNVKYKLDLYEWPPFGGSFMKKWAGRHWKHNDPTVQLPKPNPDHILVKRGKFETKR
eukprot:scaffold83052_cov59-Attheya_sp.AAC.1